MVAKMFEQLEAKIQKTPLVKYGKTAEDSFTRTIAYDGTPLNLFFARHNVDRADIPKILDDSGIGNALNIPRGYPIIINI